MLIKSGDMTLENVKSENHKSEIINFASKTISRNISKKRFPLFCKRIKGKEIARDKCVRNWSETLKR